MSRYGHQQSATTHPGTSYTRRWSPSLWNDTDTLITSLPIAS